MARTPRRSSFVNWAARFYRDYLERKGTDAG
jgi:hypothetical protein